MDVHLSLVCALGAIFSLKADIKLPVIFGDHIRVTRR